MNLGRIFLRGLAISMGALCALGCGDDSGSGGPAGRGTAACQDWQDALCDLAADECNSAPRDVCDDQYKGIECLDDEQASACANAFQAASCAAPPSNCDFADIADPAPAMAKCEKLVRAVCAVEMRCGGTRSVDECVQSVKDDSGIDCAGAISAELGYEDCMEGLKTVTCDKTMSVTSSCTGIIRAAM